MEFRFACALSKGCQEPTACQFFKGCIYRHAVIRGAIRDWARERWESFWDADGPGRYHDSY